MKSPKATVISDTGSMVAGEPYPGLVLRKTDGGEPLKRLMESLKKGWLCSLQKGCCLALRKAGEIDWTGSLGEVCVCGGHWADRVPSGGLDCE